MRTILLIEDDHNDALLTQRALQETGILHRLIHLTDGEDAIMYLNGDPPYNDRATYPLPSLVLLDLKMPKLTGFDVLTWLQERPALAALFPVIVLTGSIHPGDMERAQQLGAVGYELKPVAFNDLVKIAERSAGVSQTPHPQSAPPQTTPPLT